MSDPLVRVEQAQGHLLSLIERRDVDLDSPAIERASEALADAVSELAAMMQTHPDLCVAESVRLRRTATNHGVLAARLERRREGLTRELGNTRLARRVLDAADRPQESGGSCDVAG